MEPFFDLPRTSGVLFLKPQTENYQGEPDDRQGTRQASKGLTPPSSDLEPPLVNVRLVPWAVFNTSTLQLGLYIFGDSTLDPHSIHAAHVSRCSLPPSNPARFRVNQRDNPVKICRGARLDTVRRAFHLKNLLTIGATILAEVSRGLDE